MTRDFFAILARIADPKTPLETACALCGELVPKDLFTVMRFHESTVEVERLYSTLPETYPVRGRKPKRETEWGERVLVDRHVNLGSGEEAIIWAFSDHQTILSLGLTEVLNVPVVRGVRVLGTINVLRKAPAFTEADATVAQMIAATLAARGAKLV